MNPGESERVAELENKIKNDEMLRTMMRSSEVAALRESARREEALSWLSALGGKALAEHADIAHSLSGVGKSSAIKLSAMAEKVASLAMQLDNMNTNYQAALDGVVTAAEEARRSESRCKIAEQVARDAKSATERMAVKLTRFREAVEAWMWRNEVADIPARALTDRLDEVDE